VPSPRVGPDGGRLALPVGPCGSGPSARRPVAQFMEEPRHGGRDPVAHPLPWQCRIAITQPRPSITTDQHGRTFLRCSKVEYAATVSSDQGEVAFIQLVKAKRHGCNNDGSYNLQYSRASSWTSARAVLRTPGPMAPSRALLRTTARSRWLRTSIAIIRTGGRRAPQSGFTIFCVFLLFRPAPDAHWIEFGRFGWHWFIHAERSFGVNAWPMKNGWVHEPDTSEVGKVPLMWPHHIRDVEWASNRTLFDLQRSLGFQALSFPG